MRLPAPATKNQLPCGIHCHGPQSRPHCKRRWVQQTGAGWSSSWRMHSEAGEGTQDAHAAHLTSAFSSIALNVMRCRYGHCTMPSLWNCGTVERLDKVASAKATPGCASPLGDLCSSSNFRR